MLSTHEIFGLAWIKEHIPKETNRAFDAFSGSQSVAFLMKQMGIEVISNDLLAFNNQIGRCLVANTGTELNEAEVEMLFETALNKDEFVLMEELYSDVFFEQHEARFLDNFRANVERLDCDIKRSIALTVMNRSMTRKVTMGHFAHLQALNYANDPERVKRNRSLAMPLKSLFEELLPSYNAAIFDNGRNNQSLRGNALEIDFAEFDCDLAYFDPPYCGSHADYQSFYHLLETFVEYWRDKKFINGTKRYSPQRFSGFSKKSEALISFRKLFEKAQVIPRWLISYNDRSYPGIDDFAKLIGEFKEVKVHSKRYDQSRGGKGSVAGSDEILFVCS